jgi:predicted ATPase
LLEGREQQFLEAEKENTDLVFFDRGIPDIHGYMNYIGVDYPDLYKEKSLKYRYNTIFITPPWQEIYQSDNERYESYEQSLAIHNHLKKTYIELEYSIINVPIGNVEERVLFILNSLNP